MAVTDFPGVNPVSAEGRNAKFKFFQSLPH